MIHSGRSFPPSTLRSWFRGQRRLFQLQQALDFPNSRTILGEGSLALFLSLLRTLCRSELKAASYRQIQRQRIFSSYRTNSNSDLLTEQSTDSCLETAELLNRI